MNNRKIFLGILVVLLAANIFSGCKSSAAFVKDPTVPLAYLKDPSNGNLDNLAKAYSSQINKNRKAGIKQPGLFSDYAVCLALLGNRQEANKWFNNEAATFPNSRNYVTALKKALVPEFVDDQTQATGNATADVDEADAAMSSAVQNVIEDAQAKDAAVKEGTNEPKASSATTQSKKQPAKKKSSKKKGKKRK